MSTVLFDLDGTLIDTWWLYVRAYQLCLAPHFGREPSLEELAALKPTSEVRLLGNAVGGAALPGYHRAFLAHYERLHDSLCEGPYPGVPDLLAALRGRGVRLGLVTGKSRGAWEITAARCALGPFEVVITDEDVRQPKPDPEGLRRALADLAVEPPQAWYVGDSLADLDAAQAAAMPFAAVLWCKGAEEREAFAVAARERGARACLEQPAALLAMLEPEPAGADQRGGGTP